MCSKKVAGLALVITGVVFIAIGIIVGLVLPNVAHKAVEDATCVNSKESSGYELWKGPTTFTNKIYIWNITNKEGFLYRREKPKLEEKGPYIYTTKSEKIDVKFEKGQVTSKSFDQATFNKTLTAKECPACNENDQLTVLNAAYLGLMAKAGTAKNFGTAFIPLVMTSLFYHLDAKTTNRNITLFKMGQDQNPFHFNAAANPSFGSWINANQNQTFASLKRNFSQAEMSGLYGALMTSTFGPFTNSTLLTRCMNAMNPPSKDCGLAINLGAYFQAPAQYKPFIASWIHSFLCPSLSSCLNTTNSSILLLAVGTFIVDPLPKFVLGYLEENNYGLTTTRSQRDITLGYRMDKLPLPPQYPKGIPVPGPVTSHANEPEAKMAGKNSTFFTCQSTERNQRFTYAAIGGKTTVDKGLYPKASPDQLKVRGYYVQFPGQESLKPCTTKYSRQASSYELFLSQFSFAVPVSYREDVEVNGIPMHRYVLEKSALEVNNVTVLKKGVFDVRRVSQGPLFISLPRFLHGGSLYKGLNIPEPEAKKHESFLSIEPISGTAMELKLRIQLNGMILPESLSSVDQPLLNVSFLNELIPIWWSETAASIDEESAKEYSSQLFGGLRLACGLLVALPVIGGLLLIVGVVLVVIAVKKSSSVTTA